MEQIDPKTLIDKATISYQYADYEENQWTVPVIMTEKRLADVYEDASITKIKIVPNGTTVELELEIT